MSKTRYTVEDFKPHIKGTAGIISKIAKNVGCDWNTARKFIDESPTLTRMYDDECETVLDAAESVIFDGIQHKDQAAAKWYLSKKGKKRGYGDSVDVDHTGGVKIVVEYADPEAED